MFGKKKSSENEDGVLERYTVNYRGGLADYPKAKAGGINFIVFTDRFELQPTMASKSWFNSLTIPYKSVNDLQIVARQVGTAEGLLGGLNSRQLNQANNIHITFLSQNKEMLVRLEMLTGVTVMGQAKKCQEFEDRLRTHGIRSQFVTPTSSAPAQGSGVPDLASQIEKLSNLLKQGILTEAEFKEAKMGLIKKSNGI